MSAALAFRTTCLLTLCAAVVSAAELDRSVLAMGTQLDLHLEGEKSKRLGAASEAGIAEVSRIERACSTWRPDSLWTRFNGSTGPFALGLEWIGLLKTALHWQAESGGAFNPTLGALVQVWGLRHGGAQPTASAVAEARAHAGAALLQLDAGTGMARWLPPGGALEEGAFVKGYALDRARAVMARLGARRGWMSFGGQLLVWGAPREVGVAAPSQRDQERLRLTLNAGSLSTSGSSERGRHHLDPRTGTLSPDWGSVSAVAADGLTADILTTALFVMGPEAGMPWAEAHHVAAVFQDHHGSVQETLAFQALHPQARGALVRPQRVVAAGGAPR